MKASHNSVEIWHVESLESKNNVESSRTTNVELLSKLCRILVELCPFVLEYNGW